MRAETMIYLSVGTCAMLLPMLLLAKKYGIPVWKTILTGLILTVTGTISTKLWFFVENLTFSGRSFYGAVFLVPLAFLVIASLLRVPYGDAIDLCAPAECVMLVIMKYQCLTGGCCLGKVLYTNTAGVDVLFPSQIAEAICALMIAVVLMLLAQKPGNRGKLFPWYMIIYGASRFILNLFRADDRVFLMGMTAGNFWSIISVFAAAGWMYLAAEKAMTEKQD